MKRLEDKRVWLGGGAVAALLIMLVGWFMFIGPKRSSIDDLNAQAAQTRQSNTLLQQQVKSLQIKSTQITKYTASLKAALSALPFDSGLPAFTRQLSAQGAASGVVVTSVVVGGVTSVTAAQATAPTADTTGAATAEPVATDPTATDPAVTPTTAPTATTSAGGLFSVAVTVQSDGTLAHQLSFLKDIQTAGPRRALVSSTQVAPGTGAHAATSIDSSSTFTTSITVFSAPQTPDQIAQLNQLLSGKIGN